MVIKGLPAENTLSLKNNGELAIFFLGVGSAFAKTHYQNNIIIIKGEDHVMVDCGTKAPQALHELGLSVTDIKHLIITHSHADHIGGLEEMMLMHRYVTQEKPTMYINATYQHLLWDLSLRGGAAYNEEIEGSDLTFSDMFNVVRPNWLPTYPRETLEANIGSINIKMFRTKHIPDHPDSWQSSFWSCGLVIDDRVMFTSDTRFDRELIDSFEGIFEPEVIFHDCQFYTGGVHAGIDELGELPLEVRKKMILMHYGDNWKEHEKKVEDLNFMGLAQQWKSYCF